MKLVNCGKNLFDPVVSVTLQPLPEDNDMEMTLFSSYTIYEYLPVFNFIMLMFIFTGILTIVIRYIRKMEGKKRKLFESWRAQPLDATKPHAKEMRNPRLV